MRNKLEQRVAVLKAEYESGQKMLTDLEAKEAKLRETLLRLSEAIQTLENELAQAQEPVPSKIISPTYKGSTR